MIGVLGSRELDLVARTIGDHSMLEPAERVLVAFSGGADSTALAQVLAELGYDVALGHVDHGLRPESHDEAEHCRAVAARLGLDFALRRVIVDPPTQSEARVVRYRALEEMAGELRAKRIATGHTRSDDAETVVLRMHRGGFPMGIPAVRGPIVRPVIRLTRMQTEDICRRAGVDFLLDPSNRNPKYRRVAVREELALAGPGEVDRLVRLAGRAAREASEVAGVVDQAWGEILVTAGQIRIPRSLMVSLPVAVARQMLYRAAGELGIQIGRRLVDDVLSKVVPVTGARLDLPEHRAVWSEPDCVVVGRWPEAFGPAPHRLQVGDTTVLSDWGIEIDVEPVAVDSPLDTDPHRELIDAAAAAAPLEVRAWRPGDRFHPLGGPGSKKLQDFFVDAKVPRVQRDRVPIVTAGGRIVWLVGHRLDERARVRPDSNRALRCTVRTISNQREG